MSIRFSNDAENKYNAIHTNKLKGFKFCAVCGNPLEPEHIERGHIPICTNDRMLWKKEVMEELKKRLMAE